MWIKSKNKDREIYNSNAFFKFYIEKVGSNYVLLGKHINATCLRNDDDTIIYQCKSLQSAEQYLDMLLVDFNTENQCPCNQYEEPY